MFFDFFGLLVDFVDVNVVIAFLRINKRWTHFLLSKIPELLANNVKSYQKQDEVATLYLISISCDWKHFLKDVDVDAICSQCLERRILAKKLSLLVNHTTNYEFGHKVAFMLMSEKRIQNISEVVFIYDIQQIPPWIPSNNCINIEELRMGDFCEIRGEYGSWWCAKILLIRNEKWFIKYMGWGALLYEWIIPSIQKVALKGTREIDYRHKRCWVLKDKISSIKK